VEIFHTIDVVLISGMGVGRGAGILLSVIFLFFVEFELLLEFSLFFRSSTKFVKPMSSVIVAQGLAIQLVIGW